MTNDQARVLLDVMTGVIESEAGGTGKVVRAVTNRDYKPDPKDRKSTRLNSSHIQKSRMPSSA